MIHLTSRSLARVPHLAAFLERRAAYARRVPGGAEAVAGWGNRASGRRARELSASHGLPCLLLEDGFLRSVGREEPPLSIVVDDRGVYYDAGAPSRLEGLVRQPVDAVGRVRARNLIVAWREAGVSKYNSAREREGPLPARYVLVCDQVMDDASVRGGLAGAESFARMLEAALAENPDCRILVKTHPDAQTRRRRGYFDPMMLASQPRILPVTGRCHPVRLIANAETVYTVTSQMGFEALLWGRRVRCFGMPFYAGWGLTEDVLPAPSRRGEASLEQLVHAALIAYPRYVDPETGERCQVEDTLAYLALQRRMQARFPPAALAVGMPAWKRPILTRFTAGTSLRFVRSARGVPPGATVFRWAGRGAEQLPADTRVINAEDGFLRSVGLGAGLTAPLSWVFDRRGIYYDSSRPSDLERLLAETEFTPALRERAARLRRRVLDAGLSKYNVGAGAWRRPPGRDRVILVPGQVEDDASIRMGAPGIRTNLALTQAVRAANPGAYLLYKPHPDVATGLRPAGYDEGRVRSVCDETVSDTDMAALLDAVDEVHTITSLAGFEALMRGLPVTCYGQPFYAGWGLTDDRCPIGRRARRLSLDQLVAACLIVYPTYVSGVTGRFTTPERAVEELIAWRARGLDRPPLPARLMRAPFRAWRRAGNWTRHALARRGSGTAVVQAEVDHGRR